jgi:hypothetical protein
MSRVSRGTSFVSKESFPNHPYDPMIEVVVDVKGKSEHTKLLNLGLMNMVLFPQMDIDMFYEMKYGLSGEV